MFFPLLPLRWDATSSLARRHKASRAGTLPKELSSWRAILNFVSLPKSAPDSSELPLKCHISSSSSPIHYAELLNSKLFHSKQEKNEKRGEANPRRFNMWMLRSLVQLEMNIKWIIHESKNMKNSTGWWYLYENSSSVLVELETQSIKISSE